VKPDFKYGVVFDGWRGDGIETTSGDILNKYREIRGQLPVVLQAYDHQSADFRMVADRQGETFVKADKNQKKGVDMMNTLYKNKMLDIMDKPQLQGLITEQMMLRIDTPKQKAKDDHSDSTRFSVSQVPWDFSDIAEFRPDNPTPTKQLTYEDSLTIERRKGFVDKESQTESVDEQITEWNEHYGEPYP
jgi:hypothetical protein